jgi:hypothetical protein
MKTSNIERKREEEKKIENDVNTTAFDSRHFLIFALVRCVCIFYKR